MSVDPKIVEAIELAVEEYGQGKELTNKIVAWLNNLSSGNDNPDDADANQRYLELLYDSTNNEVLSKEQML